MPVNKILGQKFPATKSLNIHQPNSLTNGPGKGIQDIHSWSDPFCESVVAILGLVVCGDLLSKDGEDSLGGVAGLKAGKERM